MKKNNNLILTAVIVFLMVLCGVMLFMIISKNGKNPPQTTPEISSEPSPTPSGAPATPTEEPSALPSETPPVTPTTEPSPTPTAVPVLESKIGPRQFKPLSSAVITKGNTSEKKIALSINVAWGEEYIEQIISVLNKYNVKTSFMIQGYWADYNEKNGCPEYLRMIYESGMELGIHGWGHDDATTLSEETLRRVLMKAHDEIESQTGYDTWLYAPASGYVNDSVAEIAADLGFRTVTWTVDSVDWNRDNPTEVFNTIKGQIGNGTIFLFHPTEILVEVLPMLIEEATAQGYTVTTISDCIA